MNKVLIIGQIENVLALNLSKLGYKCTHIEESDEKSLKAFLPECVGLCVRTFVVDKTLIDLGKNLKFIGRAGSGLDKIDVKYAESKGIKVMNSPSGNADAVAEHAIGMMLGILHHITKSDKELRMYKFLRRANTGTELGSKTIGVIGYGNTGSRIAKRLIGFGCKVLVYDKYLSGFGTENIIETDMKQIFEETDILTIHLQLNDETSLLVNKDFVSKFKKPIYIINTSRGGILNTADAIQLLDAGKILGMGLDVFENEDLKNIKRKEKQRFKNLRKRENVIITPHIAGWSIESEYKIASVLSEKIKDFTQLS